MERSRDEGLESHSGRRLPRGGWLLSACFMERPGVRNVLWEETFGSSVAVELCI